jgi:hypothetical protein
LCFVGVWYSWDSQKTEQKGRVYRTRF